MIHLEELRIIFSKKVSVRQYDNTPETLMLDVKQSYLVIVMKALALDSIEF